MARLFLSSVALVAAFLSSASAQDVFAFGSSWNIENRENAAGGWSFIPNYGESRDTEDPVIPIPHPLPWLRLDNS